MRLYHLIAVPLPLASLVMLLGATAATGAVAPDTSAKAIPWDQIGAKAGADYQREGLSVTPAATGARRGGGGVFPRPSVALGPSGYLGAWTFSCLNEKMLVLR